jgi:hypothetical protein
MVPATSSSTASLVFGPSVVTIRRGCAKCGDEQNPPKQGRALQHVVERFRDRVCQLVTGFAFAHSLLRLPPISQHPVSPLCAAIGADRHRFARRKFSAWRPAAHLEQSQGHLIHLVVMPTVGELGTLFNEVKLNLDKRVVERQLLMAAGHDHPLFGAFFAPMVWR